MNIDQDWLSWRPWSRDSFENEKDKDTVFWFTIAVQIDGQHAPQSFREQAWVELLKRGIKEPDTTLPYLISNAPEPYSYEARKLMDKYLANKKSLKTESRKLLNKRLAKKPS